MNKLKTFFDVEVDSAWAFGLLFFLSPIAFPILVFINEVMIIDFPPSDEILQLHNVRMIVFSLSFFGAVIAVSKQVLAGITWKQLTKWGSTVILLSIVPLIGSAWFENPIRHISCCGLSIRRIWGWVYGWITCYGTLDFCGFSQGIIDWMAVIGNVVFYSSFIVIFVAIWKGKRIRLFKAIHKEMEL